MSHFQENTVLSIGSVLDIACIDSLQVLLQKTMRSDEDCHLSGSEVERITTPALQLLIAAQKSLDEHGHRLFIHDPSPVFKEACAALGLDSLLALWSTYVQ